tara:strand:- start:10643 stop:12355 length:1713 start_codon:yes stop_codon:yes gene_type:complete
VEFLAYALHEKSYSELSQSEITAFNDWLSLNGIYSNQNKNLKRKTLKSEPISRREEPMVTEEQQKLTSHFKMSTKDAESFHESLINAKEQHEIDALKYLKDKRKLPEHIIRKAQLGVHKDSFNRAWITIPLFNENNEVVNIRFRSISGDKAFRVCPNQPLPLYGCNWIDKSKNTVIITEGELDVLAMQAYGYDNVVSGTAGATANWKEEWIDQIESFKTFHIMYDDDSAGDKGADKLSKIIGLYRSFRVKLPTYNDVSDALADGALADVVHTAISKASPFINVTLKSVNDYVDEIESLIQNPSNLAGIPTGSAKMDQMIGGIASGLWVVTGDSGHGKTTFTTWLLWEQASRGVPVMVTSFEQRPIGTVQKLLRMELGGDFTQVSPEARRKVMDRLGTIPIHILDHYGELDFENVVESIRMSARRYHTKIHLVDHIGFLTMGQEDNERQMLEYIVRKLATVAVADDITIMLICHPNNLSVQQQRRVRITDLKGASAIRQDAHVGLVVQRLEPNEKRKYTACAVYADKIRSEFGVAGSHCTMAFDPLSCVYADEWIETPSGSKGLECIKEDM